MINDWWSSHDHHLSSHDHHMAIISSIEYWSFNRIFLYSSTASFRTVAYFISWILEIITAPSVIGSVVNASRFLFLTKVSFGHLTVRFAWIAKSSPISVRQLKFLRIYTMMIDCNQNLFQILNDIGSLYCTPLLIDVELCSILLKKQ